MKLIVWVFKPRINLFDMMVLPVLILIGLELDSYWPLLGLLPAGILSEVGERAAAKATGSEAA